MFKKCLAEFIGTALLVLIGCGTAVFTGADTVATALAFGLVVVALAYSFGAISGGHFNPAISLGMAINKRITWKEFGFYCLSQVLGGIVGAAILGLLTNQFKALGGNQMQSSIVYAVGSDKMYHAYAIGLLAELILTFLFVFVALVVTKEKDNKLAGLIIGLTLALVHILGLAITGTSVNPARSFGPALLQAFAGNTEAIKQIWIFIVGPFIGAALAGFTYDSFFAPKEEKKVEEQKEKEEK